MKTKINSIKKLLTLVSAFILVSCAHQKSETKVDPNLNNSKVEKIKEVATQIKTLQPNLPKQKREEISNAIHLTAKHNKIDPKIMVAILHTESNFDGKKVSNTGDISVAQINMKVWRNEYKRIFKKDIDEKKLKSDDRYAIFIMGKILKHLKQRYAKNDNEWFARYHSSSETYKNKYNKKIQTRLKKLKGS